MLLAGSVLIPKQSPMGSTVKAIRICAVGSLLGLFGCQREAVTTPIAVSESVGAPAKLFLPNPVIATQGIGHAGKACHYSHISHYSASF